jgi:hypothetical protein
MMCSQLCKLVVGCRGVCGSLLLQPHRPPLLGLLLRCGCSSCGLLQLAHGGLPLFSQLQIPVAVDLSQLRRVPLRQLLPPRLQLVNLLMQGAKLMLRPQGIPGGGCGVCRTLALQLLVCLLQRRQLFLENCAALRAAGQLCQLAPAVQVQRVALLLQDVQPRLQHGTLRRRCCSLLLSKLSRSCACSNFVLQLRNPGRVLHLLLFGLRLLLPVLRFEILS